MATLGLGSRFLLLTIIVACLAATIEASRCRSSRYRYRSSRGTYYSSSGGNGVVAGIVIGSIAGVALVVVGVLLVCHYCKKSSVGSVPGNRGTTASTKPPQTSNNYLDDKADNGFSSYTFHPPPSYESSVYQNDSNFNVYSTAEAAYPPPRLPAIAYPPNAPPPPPAQY